MNECFCLVIQIIIISGFWLPNNYLIYSFIMIVGADDVKLPAEGQFEAFGKFIIYHTFHIEVLSMTLRPCLVREMAIPSGKGIAIPRNKKL
jgi:hypothetical protein